MFSEDTLLLGMETAGTEFMTDKNSWEPERKGIGTPATRASIIERLIKMGYAERRKRNLVPTEKGICLIKVLPDTLTSPKLTAEWEYKLRQVQLNELTESEFMSGIAAFTKEIVAENNAPKPEFAELFGNKKGEPIGVCPHCGSSVREAAKVFSCDNHSCGFKLWKESRFWSAKRKNLTAAIAAGLLKDGRVELKGLYSERTGKYYDATVILDSKGEGQANYKLDFGGAR